MRRFASRLLVVVLFCGLSSFAQWHDLKARLESLSPQQFADVRARAENGDTKAQLLVAAAYDYGVHVPHDKAASLTWLKQSAEANNSEAQFMLANLYLTGSAAVPQNYQRNLYWLKRAAALGHVVAEHNLAMAYFSGRAGERNISEGQRWLTRSAEDGFTHSQFVLGKDYLSGNDGFPKDADRGEMWVRKAAEKGHGAALVLLAKFYSTPDFVPRDPTYVEMVLNRAAEMRIPQAQYQLGAMYRRGLFRNPEYSRAIEWLQLAAAKGYAPADHQLGEIYAGAEGVPPDPRQAVDWFRAGAELGFTPSIFSLASSYRDGRGAPLDPVAAVMWFTIAAERGAPESQQALAAMQRDLPAKTFAAGQDHAHAWIAAHPGALVHPPGMFNVRYGLLVPDEQPPDRGPSTAEERERAVLVARQLEQDPLGPESEASRTWMLRWMAEVPDFFFHQCALLASTTEQKFPDQELLEKQAYLSAAAYLIQHPEKINDQLQVYIAGVEGALRAYRARTAQEPAARSAVMDDLLRISADGSLAAQIHQRVDQRCR